MPRRAFRLAPLALALLAPAALGQTKDRVYFRDRAADKVTDLEGDVVETASGVKFTGADKKERVIPAFDLVRIEYGTLDPVLKQAAAQQENEKDATKPLAYYAGKIKELATANEKTKRFLQFREAYWAAKVADAKTADADFAADGKKAVDKLLAFVKANRKTWEQWQLARTAARIAGETGDWKGADDALKELAGVADAPADLKADLKLMRVGYLLRGGNYPEATALVGELEKETGAARERAAIYKEALAVLPAKDGADPKAAVGKIDALIAKAKDPAVWATGYAALGEVYLAHKLPRDAMWSYLWVDTVYTQDKDERVRALHRLIELFDEGREKDGEKNRSDQFRDKLPKVR